MNEDAFDKIAVRVGLAPELVREAIAATGGNVGAVKCGLLVFIRGWGGGIGAFYPYGINSEDLRAALLQARGRILEDPSQSEQMAWALKFFGPIGTPLLPWVKSLEG